MQRCLELAALGMGKVSPNPMVGSVIVYNDKIIGEGYHFEVGKAHAEVNAINSVQNKSLLKKATLYVNLEPCSHFGKTPPCADLIVKYQIPKVVIGTLDPNEKVSGNGIKRLKEAKIKVIEHVLEKESQELNKRFFKFHKEKLPYVILKFAQTTDQFIARKNYDSKWISNEFSRKIVHKWRGQEDAIMIGTNTAIYDNPKLTTRDYSGKNPIRIVLDKTLKLNPNSNLYNQEANTIFVTQKSKKDDKDTKYINLIFEDKKFILNLLHKLYNLNIQSILVEGGSHLINSFVKTKLWDEARIFICPKYFNNGIPSPQIPGKIIETKHVLDDKLNILIKDEL